MEGTNTQWTKNKSKQIQNTGSKPRMMVLPSAKLRESNVEDFNVESWFNDFLNLLSVEQTFAVLLQTETHKDTGTQREWAQLQVDISYRCPDDRIPREHRSCSFQITSIQHNEKCTRSANLHRLHCIMDCFWVLWDSSALQYKTFLQTWHYCIANTTLNAIAI